MSLQDTTFLTGGTNQQIINTWELGDDRIFTGTLSGILPVSDPSFTDGYITLKQSPLAPDADAIFQLHITQTLNASGQITETGSDYIVCLFHVYSGQYQNAVLAGTTYYMDCRMISTGGDTITVATAQVVFQQNVTQTNVAGTPASLAYQGQPQFRGFISMLPNLVPANQTIYNAGDWYMNINPINGNGAGWVCLIGGVAPVTTWATLALTSGPSGDPHFKGYAPSEPTSGAGFVAADYFLNSAPASMAPEGWVYTGTVWRTKGLIGDS